MSAAAIVKSFEGCSLVAYRDTGGIWTIGYGHTKGVHAGMTCDQVDADAWLAADLLEANRDLLSCSPGPFAPGAEDALTSFVFNVGIGNYRGSTLRSFVNVQDWDLVKRELLKWDHVGKQVVAGLLNRRQAEADLITEVA